MTTFWTLLSDDGGLELFGSLWPLDGDELRVGPFLRRVCELGEDADAAECDRLIARLWKI